jgi:hypothetical protein
VIRAVGFLLAEAFWTVVHRVLDPYATRDHDDDRTTTDAFKEFVEKHKHPPDGR